LQLEPFQAVMSGHHHQRAEEFTPLTGETSHCWREQGASAAAAQFNFNGLPGAHRSQRSLKMSRKGAGRSQPSFSSLYKAGNLVPLSCEYGNMAVASAGTTPVVKILEYISL